MVDVASQSDPGGPDGAEVSDGQIGEPALESWEFHDLLFHSRSRRGRWDAPFGATYRLAHRPPPPALKPIDDGDWQDLFRPDIERLMREDPPLAQVTEQRRSVRQYGAEPITAKQLGEFLFRTARVTRHWQSEVSAPSGPLTMDFTARPYPSGGGLYELEVYLAVKNCAGVEPGLHYYDPQGHRLQALCGATRDVEGLLADAAASAGIAAQSLQVLVVLAARFSRTAWKYESIAYALTLKHVGVVFQTMYLAATAMGLAPCAVGCGDSDLFARAAGTDWCVETSVGEFLLGSKE
jgi:SagB-type dehydrogenase family enzyme